MEQRILRLAGKHVGLHRVRIRGDDALEDGQRIAVPDSSHVDLRKGKQKLLISRIFRDGRGKRLNGGSILVSAEEGHPEQGANLVVRPGLQRLRERRNGSGKVTALELRQAQIQGESSHVRCQSVGLPVGAACFVVVAHVGHVEAKMGKAGGIAGLALDFSLPESRSLGVVPRLLCGKCLSRSRGRLPKDQRDAYEQQKECNAFHERYGDSNACSRARGWHGKETGGVPVGRDGGLAAARR